MSRRVLLRKQSKGIECSLPSYLVTLAPNKNNSGTFAEVVRPPGLPQDTLEWRPPCVSTGPGRTGSRVPSPRNRAGASSQVEIGPGPQPRATQSIRKCTSVLLVDRQPAKKTVHPASAYRSPTIQILVSCTLLPSTGGSH